MTSTISIHKIIWSHNRITEKKILSEILKQTNKLVYSLRKIQFNLPMEKKLRHTAYYFLVYPSFKNRCSVSSPFKKKDKTKLYLGKNKYTDSVLEMSKILEWTLSAPLPRFAPTPAIVPQTWKAAYHDS